MAIVGGMNSIGRVLTEIRHFLFCCHSSHFVAFSSEQKNLIQISRRGEKEAGKTVYGNGPETSTGKHDKCDDTPEILRQHKGNIHVNFVV